MKILTDLTAALPKELAEKYNIDIIPIKISWEEEGIDGVIEGTELFKRMRAAKGKTGPKTSQPSIGIYKTYFEEALKENDELVYIAMSSGTSGGYNAAMQAKKFIKGADRIHIIDSYNVDAGQALMVLKAQELKEKGSNAEEVINYLEKNKDRFKLIGFAGDPEWLEKSGRLSHTGANLVRKMTDIGMRPLLGIRNGKVVPVSLKLKAKNKIDALLKDLQEKIGNKEALLAITHGDIKEEALQLKKEIELNFPNTELLFIREINPIVGAHAGPGTIICSYYLK